MLPGGFSAADLRALAHQVEVSRAAVRRELERAADGSLSRDVLGGAAMALRIAGGALKDAAAQIDIYEAAHYDA